MGKNGADKKYVWSVFDDSELKLWPEGNKVVYFMHKRRGEILPPSALERDERSLLMPPATVKNVWKKFAVSVLGYARHTGGYYHSRRNESFIDLIVVDRGEFGAKFGTQKLGLGRGEYIAIPSGVLCDNFADNSDTRVWWIHFCDVPFWRAVFGSEISAGKMEGFEVFAAAMRAYLCEVYSPKPSVALLENFGESIVEILCRAFAAAPESDVPVAERVREIASEISANPRSGKNISEYAKKLSVSVRTLDNYFRKYVGMPYAKCVRESRMKIALADIRAGLPNAAIAEKLGYCDAYAFARAVRGYFGKYPRELKREFSALK